MKFGFKTCNIWLAVSCKVEASHQSFVIHAFPKIWLIQHTEKLNSHSQSARSRKKDPWRITSCPWFLGSHPCLLIYRPLYWVLGQLEEWAEKIFKLSKDSFSSCPIESVVDQQHHAALQIIVSVSAEDVFFTVRLRWCWRRIPKSELDSLRRSDSLELYLSAATAKIWAEIKDEIASLLSGDTSPWQPQSHLC